MKSVALLLLGATATLVFAGCASIKDRSEKYRDVIGKRFEMRYEMALWKMRRHEYEIVPYRFESTKSELGSLGTKIAVIPAGTIVTVKDAKVSYVGGDWDFLLAEFKLPNTGETIQFEWMLGFSSVDPREIYKRWTPVP